MPQFVMENAVECAREESAFVLGFIEAMFFTEQSPGLSTEEWLAGCEPGTNEGSLPGDVGYCDIHPDSLAAIRADCEAWQAANSELLEQAYSRDYDETQAGRDYWFTRNGHGVGFWDRKELELDSDEYERLTQVMIDNRHNNAAWGAALAERTAIESQSIGDKLTEACQYREVNPFFANHVTHGDSPFVHVDLPDQSTNR